MRERTRQRPSLKDSRILQIGAQQLQLTLYIRLARSFFTGTIDRLHHNQVGVIVSDTAGIKIGQERNWYSFMCRLVV